MWKKMTALLVAIGVLFTLFSGCGVFGRNSDEQAADEDPATPVEVAVAEVGDLKNTRFFTAKLKPSLEAMVLPKMPGVVETVHVVVGQSVKNGEVLVTLSGSDVDMQIMQAQAGYNTAKANVNLSRSRLEDLNKQKRDITDGLKQIEDRLAEVDAALSEFKEQQDNLEASYKAELITQEAYTQAAAQLSAGSEGALVKRQALQQQKTALEEGKRGIENAIKSLPFNADTLSAQLEQAEVGLKMARNSQGNLSVTSPIDGVVSIVTVYEGGMAAQTMPPVTVVNTELLILDIMVTEAEITQIVAGETVQVYVDAFSKEPITGTIVYASPTPDPRTQGYPVRIQSSNTEGVLKPGMFARVELILARREKAITVDKRAIMLRDGKRYVYVAKGEIAERIEVETGFENQDRVEILKGIQSGDRVIIKGQEFIKDHGKIRILEGDDA